MKPERQIHALYREVDDWDIDHKSGPECADDLRCTVLDALKTIALSLGEPIKRIKTCWECEKGLPVEELIQDEDAYDSWLCKKCDEEKKQEEFATRLKYLKEEKERIEKQLKEIETEGYG